MNFLLFLNDNKASSSHDGSVPIHVSFPFYHCRHAFTNGCPWCVVAIHSLDVSQEPDFKSYLDHQTGCQVDTNHSHWQRKLLQSISAHSPPPPISNQGTRLWLTLGSLLKPTLYLMVGSRNTTDKWEAEAAELY